MSHIEFIVDRPEALAQLQRPATKATIRRIRLSDPVANEHIERQLNASYFACGCQQGSFAVGAVSAGCLSLGLWGGFEGPLAWGWVLAYVVVGALLGKLSGLAFSRHRLRRIYRRIEEAFAITHPAAINRNQQGATG